MCSKQEVREVLEEKEWFVPNLKCAKRTSGIKTNISLMQKDIKTILKKLDGMEKKFANKWTERWIITVTIIFALASLYLIFDKANLPH